jgi:glycosyltransferase involved in cell wall biosynthesis
MYRPVVRELLEPIIAALQSGPERLAFVLLGRGGEEFRRELVERYPGLAGRVHAPGGLAAAELSHHLSACDLMLQPYPDGVNGRQSSMAAVLVHGRAAVSTTAESTEPMWAESGAVALVATGDAAGAAAEVRRLVADPAERARMGARARELYRRSYDWERIVRELRSS